MSHLNSNMGDINCCGDAGLNYKLGQLGHRQLRFTRLSNKRNVKVGGGGRAGIMPICRIYLCTPATAKCK